MSENPALELLRHFFAGVGFREVPATKTYSRDDLVRVVLGQQWAVAIALHRGIGWWSDNNSTTLGYVGDLPCAVDVVEEMEQS